MGNIVKLHETVKCPCLAEVENNCYIRIPATDNTWSSSFFPKSVRSNLTSDYRRVQSCHHWQRNINAFSRWTQTQPLAHL
jgi:hypothetical protein